MAYLWLKAFHIIGVVVWFAGLFYLVRLFVYHAEVREQPEPAQSILKSQYELMEKRLYNIITMPGMVVTVVMAIGLLVAMPSYLRDWWMHLKLSFVGLLLGYHFYCGYLMRRLAANQCNWTGQQMRLLNEAPTVLLLVIVLLAVFKNSLPLDLTTFGIIAAVFAMAVGIQLYAKKRKRDKEKLDQEQAIATASEVPQGS